MNVNMFLKCEAHIDKHFTSINVTLLEMKKNNKNQKI